MGIVVVKVLRKVSNERKVFIGTAFFINKTTLVTARHVIEYAEGDDIYLRELPNGGDLLIPKNTITICEERDVAFFKTRREFQVEQVQISSKQIDVGSEVEIKGYYKIDEGVKEYKHHVSALSNAQYTFELQGHLTEGLSGSPVFVNNKIVGIAQAISQDKNITYIIPISECCCEPEMEELDNGLLKDITNEVFGDDIDAFRKLAYLVMPREVNKTLNGSIDDIIDVLSSIRDMNHHKNIPLLCLAMKLYNYRPHDDIAIWLEHVKKNYSELNGFEPECIDNKVEDSRNILIEISIAHKNIHNAIIQVWENRVLIEGKIDYQKIEQGYREKIDLKNNEEIQSFLDDFTEYLQNFNRQTTLLEFVLPIELLNDGIRLWENIEGYEQLRRYRFVYRLYERFKNYEHYKDFWKTNWEDMYQSNKAKTIIDSSLLLEREDDVRFDEFASEEYSSVITRFPVEELSFSKKICKSGMSILIAPHSSLKGEELIEFNTWFEMNFEETEMNKLVREVNKFFSRFPNRIESKIILIWDNPNRIPIEYTQKRSLYQL